MSYLVIQCKRQDQDDMAQALDEEWKEGFDVTDDEKKQSEKKNIFRLIS